MSNDAGYSRRPLAAKLGLKPGMAVVVCGAPVDYQRLIAPAPDGLAYGAQIRKTTDLVHVFSTERATLASVLTHARGVIRPDAVIWVSWPKKASRVATDITEDVIREICLPRGLVDVKVCAVDEVWSGLKLVIRRALR